MFDANNVFSVYVLIDKINMQRESHIKVRFVKHKSNIQIDGTKKTSN